MQIEFYGAVGTVTGSKYLLTIAGKKILVDCGLFQGLKELRLRNWQAPPFNPAELAAVIITHAHIDHTGYLPLLVKNGFNGPIYATAASCDLMTLLLRDSAHLQEEDAKRANKYGYSKHATALPLYTKDDAEDALRLLHPVDFGKVYTITEDFTACWRRAGHILGAAFVECHYENDSILVFSGDLGRPNDPVMQAPQIMQTADYLVLESTYGDRLHEEQDIEQHLATIINETTQLGGSVVIPSFAVGRAQSLLYHLYQLKKKQLIRDFPIYLDSPMAISATEIMQRHPNEHRLSKELCRDVCSVATYINTPEESKAIDNNRWPSIIISASGMATGGRIIHHLKVFAPDRRNTILFAGYQAAGTRGAAMLGGAKEIKIHGQYYPVEARVEYLPNISAHADYSEIMAWLRQCNHTPKQVFITHGEPKASQALRDTISKELGWSCSLPQYGDAFTL